MHLTYIISLFISFFQQPVLSQEYSHARIVGIFKESVPTVVSGSNVRVEGESIPAMLSASGVTSITALNNTRRLVQRDHMKQKQVAVLHFDVDIDVELKIAELDKTGLFEILEPDFIGTGGGFCRTIPNEVYFARQWALYNDGTFDPQSIPDADIDMDNAWEIAQGDTNIVVCIIDSGTRLGHPDFKGRLWYNYADTTNSVDDDDNGYVDDFIGWDFVNNDNDPTDDLGHGTNITSIIGAKPNNIDGYAGVDWNCKLMSCKVLSEENFGYYSWWIAAIYYAVDNGASVLNMSLGGTSQSAAMKSALEYARDNNVVVVASMMNTNSNISYYPSAYNTTIAVGATDTDNRRVESFFWGGGSNYGDHIDLVAPGNYIYGLSYLSDSNVDSYWGGTSQATAFVSGVVSVLRGMDPSLSVDDVEKILFDAAEDLVGKASDDAPGWDEFYGHGLLNAHKSLVLAGSSRMTFCAPVTYNDSTYTESTVLYDSIETSSGCDSLFAIRLSIEAIDASVNFSNDTLWSLMSDASYQWLDCDNGFQPISGATNQSFSFPEGVFAVEISTDNCKDTSDCHSIIPAGIESVSGTFLNAAVYPNPTSGELNIELGTVANEVQVRLWSTSGKIAFDNTYYGASRIMFNNAALQLRGQYFIELISSEGWKVIPVVLL